MSRGASLLALLEQHRAADDREEGFRRRMRALAAEGESAFARTQFDPGHFTASAFVRSPDRGSILLVLHGKLGRWLQPGGHVDPEDQDVAAAAAREVAEEVGIHGLVPGGGPLDLDIHAIPPLRGDPTHEHFDVRFEFVAPSWEFVAGSDARAARWVQLEQVSETESDASVMRAVEKLRRR